METKICKKCGIEKPVSDFGKGGKQLRANGEWKQYYHTTCKQCVNHPRVRKDNLDPKVCNKCGVSKPLSEYAYDAKRDRYRGDCKQCKYKQRLKHRAENPEVIERERERNRWRHNNIPEVAERNRRQGRETYKRHGEKYKKKVREKYTNDPEYAEKQRQYKRNLWAENEDYRNKLKEKNKIYREENKEELRIKQKKYVEENKDKIKERQRKYYYDNPEHMKKLRKAQYEKHQEKLVEDQRRIRDERRQYLREYLGGKCVRCGSIENLEFDHIIKENKSFTISSSLTCFSIEDLILEADKCQLLCRPCHIEKSHEEDDWRKLTNEERKNRIRR